MRGKNLSKFWFVEQLWAPFENRGQNLTLTYEVTLKLMTFISTNLKGGGTFYQVIRFGHDILNRSWDNEVESLTLKFDLEFLDNYPNDPHETFRDTAEL